MLKFVFPLCYKYSAKYCAISNGSTIFRVVRVYYLFTRSIMITLSISARTGLMFRSSQQLLKLCLEYPLALGPSTFARFSIVPADVRMHTLSDFLRILK